MKSGNDIGHPEDKRDMYWKMMEMTFVSEAAAYDFYNSYAREHGFTIRKSKTKSSKGPLREVRRRWFVCSREGKLQSKLLTMENCTRRLRPESRCYYKAQMAVKLDKKNARFGALQNLMIITVIS